MTGSSNAAEPKGSKSQRVLQGGICGGVVITILAIAIPNIIEARKGG